jgi:CRISPR-associated exonuclease Cas4
VPEGALFYGENRRRTLVRFDVELRVLTERIAEAARAMVRSGITPPPDYSPRKCSQCSLIDLCQPRRLSQPPKVADWLRRQLGE